MNNFEGPNHYNDNTLSNSDDVFKRKISASSNLNEKLELLIDFSAEYTKNNRLFIKETTNHLMQQLKKSDNNLGWCYFILARLKIDSNQYDDGLDFLTKAKLEFEADKAKKGLLTALCEEGRVYEKMGIYDKAFGLYFNSLDLAKKEKDYSMTANIKNNLGELFNQLKQFNTAKEYFSKALAIKGSSARSRAVSYCNLGQSYRQLGDYQQAKKAILNALLIAKRIKSKYIMAFSLLETGILNRLQQDIKRAKYYFRRALDLTNNLDFPMLTGLIYLQLGQTEKSTGRLEEALSLLEEALKIFNSNSAKGYEAITLLDISNIHGILGDHQKAYFAATSGKIKQEQVFNEHVTYLMNIMQLKQATKEKFIYKELYQRINIISEMGRAITSTLDINDIGRITFAHISNLMETCKLVIGLFSENKDALEYKINIGNGDFFTDHSYNGRQNISRLIEYFSNNVNLIVTSDTIKDYPFGPLIIPNETEMGLTNNGYISCPLWIKDKLIGFITLESKKHFYSLRDADTLQAIAVYLAIALENERYYSHAGRLASIDSLTGLYNRRKILEKAEEEFNLHKKECKPLSFLLVNLNDLTHIKNNFGSSASEKAVQCVTEILKNTMRDFDIGGRISEDLFLVILPNTTINIATILSDTLYTNFLKINILLQKTIINIKVNLGLAQLEEADVNVHNLIKRSGIAVVNSKINKGNFQKSR